MSKLAEMAGAVRTVTGYAILLQLCDHYNDEKRLAWPSHETLMQKTQRSRPSVIRALRHLEAVGLVITQPGLGRGNVSTYRLPFVEAALKGITDDTFVKEEKVSAVNRKGIKREQKGISADTQNLLENQVKNQLRTRDETRPPAREELPEPVKTKRPPVSGPHQAVVDCYHRLWPLTGIRFPGGKAVVLEDLRHLRERCAKDDAGEPLPDEGVGDACAILEAFHRSLNGDRPHLRIIIDHVGRWRKANRPAEYDPRNPPRLEGGYARGISVHSRIVGPDADDATVHAVYGKSRERQLEQERQYQLLVAKQNGRLGVSDG